MIVSCFCRDLEWPRSSIPSGGCDTHKVMRARHSYCASSLPVRGAGTLYVDLCYNNIITITISYVDPSIHVVV